MRKFLSMCIIALFLVVNGQGCEIPDMTPEDIERIEREWERQEERERIEGLRPRPEDWERYIQ